jgi:polysaccharide export outer membrane protein
MAYVSCAPTQKITYFQGLDNGEEVTLATAQDIKIQPEDKISIVVSSKDPQLASLFNLPLYTNRVGATEGASSNQNSQLSCYTVDAGGTIDFPVLGRIAVQGLGREEIASRIKQQLMERNLMQDPVVTVEFVNLYISVLGEVGKPGRFPITRDRITILDALSMAGDLTIYGKRDGVYVLRSNGKKQVKYAVNLSSGEGLYSSPVYYLHQNDVVYVEPNAMRARQSTVNGNNILSASFWVSLASLITSITVLIVK